MMGKKEMQKKKNLNEMKQYERRGVQIMWDSGLMISLAMVWPSHISPYNLRRNEHQRSMSVEWME
jgi:hypothetical protein